MPLGDERLEANDKVLSLPPQQDWVGVGECGLFMSGEGRDLMGWVHTDLLASGQTGWVRGERPQGEGTIGVRGGSSRRSWAQGLWRGRIQDKYL